jgi:hypothetical protein
VTRFVRLGTRAQDRCLTHLEEEDGTEAAEDRARLVVDGMDADDVDGRAERDEDHRRYRLKQVELGTHVQRPFRVEEGDGCARGERRGNK